MKNKVVNLMLTGVISGSVFAFTAVPAAMAQETEATTAAEDDGSIAGLLSSILGDAGLDSLSGVVSDNKDAIDGGVNDLVGALSDIDESYGDLIESLQEKYADLDLDQLKQLIADATTEAGLDLNALEESITNALAEEGLDLEALLEGSGLDLEALLNGENLEQFEALIPLLFGAGVESETEAPTGDPMDAVDSYLEDFAATFEPADVTLPVKQVVSGGSDLDNGTFFTLGDFWVFNYNVDSDKLVFVSGGEQAALIYSIPQDDGSYAYTADEATDGEGYRDEIARLCEEAGTGTTVEEFFNATDEESRDIQLMEAFLGYTEEHPEITSIEMNGEMITIDEAIDRITAYYDSIYDAIEAATE